MGIFFIEAVKKSPGIKILSLVISVKYFRTYNKKIETPLLFYYYFNTKFYRSMLKNLLNVTKNFVTSKVVMLTKKKLVTRLPNFPDRRIRYEFFLKNIVTNEKINFWNFINFFKVGVRKDVVFLLNKRF